MRTASIVALVVAAAVRSTRSCTPVSVVGDATYCCPGALCSGTGLVPAGISCPREDDAATADCHSNLPSYANGKCVAPADAVCQQIPSGAWGCAWPSKTKPAAEAAPASIRPMNHSSSGANETSTTSTPMPSP
ncbi:Aste57867_14677 [Aphanomyces stellatus]|uniref:Aste57867_14677 protein n=1 Tax=Aphanomyces stellatus TaxID=120398 RepID=A0A485L1V4_9STRA|nr:hypothetical protein As57867_014622 [Aphanomyces stellatus]VFT91495.1 Aste57867_14677 [Aphanomyces stellatus]